MTEKPTTAERYPPDQVTRVKATCLYLATKLGDLMTDLVVVGGLVPSLLVDQGNLPEDVPPHVGTLDLDLGLAFALLGGQRYEEVAERLRRAGFKADVNDEGKPTRQRWKISDPPVTVDFLIEPDDPNAKPGNLFSLTRDWAAIVAPGLHLAFRDSQFIEISGSTIAGENASRKIRVCGAGAYIVLKSLAFRIRGENKDAYDLFYLLRNYGDGVSAVAELLRPLLNDDLAKQALGYLAEDFLDPDGIGAKRVAWFLYGRGDANTQSDVAGFARELVTQCA
jgi:hypothetical protein